MHIHTHHVAESVRQEHGMSTCSYRFVGVALHQSEFLQAIGHEATYREVYVHILHTRFGYVECMVVTGLNNAVYLKLTLCKLAVDGECTCIVRAVVVDGLATAVAQYESTAFEFCHRRTTVHDLAMLAEYGGEADHCAIRIGCTVNMSCYILLGESGLGQTHSRSVHLIANHRGTLQLFYLLSLLR